MARAQATLTLIASPAGGMNGSPSHGRGRHLYFAAYHYGQVVILWQWGRRAGRQGGREREREGQGVWVKTCRRFGMHWGGCPDLNIIVFIFTSLLYASLFLYFSLPQYFRRGCWFYSVALHPNLHLCFHLVVVGLEFRHYSSLCLIISCLFAAFTVSYYFQPYTFVFTWLSEV